MGGFDTISSAGAGLQPAPLYFLFQNMGSGYKPEPATWQFFNTTVPFSSYHYVMLWKSNLGTAVRIR